MPSARLDYIFFFSKVVFSIVNTRRPKMEELGQLFTLTPKEILTARLMTKRRLVLRNSH